MKHNSHGCLTEFNEAKQQHPIEEGSLAENLATFLKLLITKKPGFRSLFVGKSSINAIPKFATRNKSENNWMPEAPVKPYALPKMPVLAKPLA
jgi:hypothetical protein